MPFFQLFYKSPFSPTFLLRQVYFSYHAYLLRINTLNLTSPRGPSVSECWELCKWRYHSPMRSQDGWTSSCPTLTFSFYFKNCMQTFYIFYFKFWLLMEFNKYKDIINWGQGRNISSYNQINVLQPLANFKLSNLLILAFQPLPPHTNQMEMLFSECWVWGRPRKHM